MLNVKTQLFSSLKRDIWEKDVWYEVTEDTFLCTNKHESHKHVIAFLKLK